jgi:predicted nucleic acid-binding protein
VTVVLDSSVTLARLYTDEVTAAVEEVFETVAETGAWVPAIWRLEVANGLQQGVLARRISTRVRDESLADLEAFEIVVDPETDRFAWSSTLRLAERFRLTLYDACYLELAQRRGLALASLDRKLRAAARALNLTLFGI